MSARRRRVFEFAVADASEQEAARLFPLLTSACGQYHSYVASGKLPAPRDPASCIVAHDRARQGCVPFTTCFGVKGRMAIIVKTDRVAAGALHTSMCLVKLDPETGKFRQDGSVYRALTGPKYQRTCWNGDCEAASSCMVRCPACGVAAYCGEQCAAAHRRNHKTMCSLLTA